jgi:hypothetical protein
MLLFAFKLSRCREASDFLSSRSHELLSLFCGLEKADQEPGDFHVHIRSRNARRVERNFITGSGIFEILRAPF